MDKLLAARQALVKRLDKEDEDSCLDGTVNDVSTEKALYIFMNGGAEENHRYIFPLKNGFCMIYDGYHILTSKTKRENKKTYRINLFVGNMNKESKNTRVNLLQSLINFNPRKYVRGYAGLLNLFGFYDYEPVRLGKDGEIQEIFSCTPLETLLT